MDRSISGSKIEPFYFGAFSKPLFGCYHAPQSEPRRDCGVVLCYPMGEEYIRFHRAYRQLAVRLSNVGIPVLRFDFYGCGDSAGDCEQGQIGQWLTDTSMAIDEVRRRCGVVKVCLVGLRFGGALAMMVGAAQRNIDGMVLWDPVVIGKDYMEELAMRHQEKLPYGHVKPEHRITGEKPTGMLGFPLTDSMFTDLENIDLLAIQQKPANNILVLDSHEEACEGRLREHLKSMDAHVEYQHLPSPQISIEIANTGLVPHQILQSLVSWIDKVYS